MPVVRHEETHFSPDDDIKGLLDQLPAQATKSIDVEIYGFTDEVLVQALITAAQGGVHVRINNDRSQAAGPADKKALQTLIDAGVGIEVKITESIRGAIDHLKMLIIDGALGPSDDGSSVLKGSYNFSDGGEKQDNFVEWSNDPGKVQQAMAKFENDWTNNKQDPAWQMKATVTAPGG